MVMPRWFYALAVLMMEAWSARRDAQIRFLKAQVEMLQARLPGNRVIVAPEERLRLLRLGAEVSHQVKDILEVVSHKTYCRWLREQEKGMPGRRVGRPRLTAELTALIARLARENSGWGIDRILGELRKLRVAVGRSSIRRAMMEEGLHPDLGRRNGKQAGETPWRHFIDLHMNTLVACDFFCKTVLTPLGRKTAYCLVFMHLGSRRVFLSPATVEPKQAWVVQQARNAGMWMQDQGIEAKFILHDQDTKFTESFDETFVAAGARIIRTPTAAPNANAFVESWIGKLRRECLDHFCCFSVGHLDHIVQAYATYHNGHRPHQSLGNVPLPMKGKPPPVLPLNGTIHCRQFLGGLLKHYYRSAA